jgi:hypothetical protein
MKRSFALLLVILNLFIFSIKSLYGSDSLFYSISVNYYKDLSDTYDGGNLFSADFLISKSWFGTTISYGHFNSCTIFEYTVNVEETDKKLVIPFDEVSNMKTGAISLVLTPIQSRLIKADFLIGFAAGKAKSLQFHDVEYSYSFQTNTFNYLFKNYELLSKTHIGYQVGLDISLFFTKRIGLGLTSRVQDLNNGGTFFFVGGGLKFKF